MKKFIIIAVLTVLLSGCTQFTSQSQEMTPQPATQSPINAVTSEPVQSAEQTLEQTLTTTQSVENKVLLPAPVYFLVDDGGKNTLFRLERSGQDSTPITEESLEVTDYAVNPVDGSIAYISDNKIFQVSPTGADKKVLVEGEPLAQSDEFFWRQRIGRPSWSPDGKILAFSQGGLRFLHMDSMKITLEIENLIEAAEGIGQIPKEIYAPSLWSPDGRRLIVDIGYYESGTIGIYDLSLAELVQPTSPSSLCCSESWSIDGSKVFISSPYLGMIQPGLWTLDPGSGLITSLVEAPSFDGPFEFVGWAVENSPGNLLYLYGKVDRIPDGSSEPLSLHKSGIDGVNERLELNPYKVKLREVIWAPDYSFALGLGDQMQLYGVDLYLIPTDGEEVTIIPFRGSYIAWGLPVSE